MKERVKEIGDCGRNGHSHNSKSGHQIFPPRPEFEEGGVEAVPNATV